MEGKSNHHHHLHHLHHHQRRRRHKTTDLLTEVCVALHRARPNCVELEGLLGEGLVPMDSVVAQHHV